MKPLFSLYCLFYAVPHILPQVIVRDLISLDLVRDRKGIRLFVIVQYRVLGRVSCHFQPVCFHHSLKYFCILLRFCLYLIFKSVKNTVQDRHPVAFFIVKSRLQVLPELFLIDLIAVIGQISFQVLVLILRDDDL